MEPLIPVHFAFSVLNYSTGVCVWWGLLFVFAFLIEGAKGGCIVLFGYIVDFFLFTTNNIEYKLYTINGQLNTVEKKNLPQKFNFNNEI